jgi:choline kinase
MKALILAAGVGQRLGKASTDRPKCLLRFNGRSLLERHLRCLRDLGIEQVVIAVGYQSELICEELNALGASRFATTVYNPDYTQGSIVSLGHLRHALAEGEVLLMDADVLYDHRLLERLIRTPLPNCFLLDRGLEMGDEPVKLCVRGDHLVEFRKQLGSDLTYDLCGESVGFFRFSSAMAARLAQRTVHYLEQGRYGEPYEEAIRDLLLGSPEAFGFEDITGLPWIEIDFPEDVRRARETILPQLVDCPIDE